MNATILILSHQLLSMVEPIKKIIEEKGYTCFILSSRSEKAEKPQWLLNTPFAHVTSSLHLNDTDIEEFLDKYGKGIQFVGCLSVWEGYRELMSRVNQRFGANDISEETVRNLRDKLAMRTKLRDAGLSTVSCQVLNESIYQSIAASDNYFIKPRIGLASMGTFPAKSLAAYSQLETLWLRASEDRNYDGVFSRDSQFIIEDFISGTECSFEISLNNFQIDVLAVHEKLDIMQETFSVLENACVCPPASLSEARIHVGKQFLGEVMKTLGVHTGIYHVEMRCDASSHWEIIEINPRIGGAFIVDSTKIHSGACLLETWLMLILGKYRRRETCPVRTTFFRVFFGLSGQKIKSIQRTSVSPSALQDKIFYKPHDTLPCVEREIFLGMALWDITDIPETERPAFFQQTSNYLVTEYQV